jgi:hypothetical protein
MVNEAPETIASFAHNQLRALHARPKCPWRYVREEREILDFGLVGDAEPFSAPQTQVGNK